MTEIDKTIRRPEDPDWIKKLETKRKQYQKRIVDQGDQYKAPELLNYQTAYALALIEALLEKGEISSFAFSRLLAAERPQFNSREFDYAFKIISDYVEDEEYLEAMIQRVIDSERKVEVENAAEVEQKNAIQYPSFDEDWIDLLEKMKSKIAASINNFDQETASDIEKGYHLRGLHSLHIFSILLEEKTAIDYESSLAQAKKNDFFDETIFTKVWDMIELYTTRKNLLKMSVDS